MIQNYFSVCVKSNKKDLAEISERSLNYHYSSVCPDISPKRLHKNSKNSQAAGDSVLLQMTVSFLRQSG